MAYLNGIDTPYMEQEQGFTVDGVATKVRIDAGVAPLDYRVWFVHRCLVLISLLNNGAPKGVFYCLNFI